MNKTTVAALTTTNTIRRRLNVILALSAVCLPGSLRAAAVAAGPLAGMGQVRSVPAFRAAVLNQIAIFSSLSNNSIVPVPSLSPSPIVPGVGHMPTVPTLLTPEQVGRMSAAPLMPVYPTIGQDPVHAAAQRLVTALLAQPQVIARHQEELLAALGEQGAGQLKEASANLENRAVLDRVLAAQLEDYRQRLDLDNARSIEEFGTRLNTLFENSKSRLGDASNGSVAGSDSAQKKIPASWKLQPSQKIEAPGGAGARNGWQAPKYFDDALAAADSLSRPKHTYARSDINWGVLRRSISALQPQIEVVADSRIMDDQKLRALQEDLLKDARSRTTAAELAAMMVQRLEDVQRHGTVPMVLFRKPFGTIFGDIPLSAPQLGMLDDMKQTVQHLSRVAPNRQKFLAGLEDLLTRLRAVNQWDSNYPGKLRRILADARSTTAL